MISFILLLKKFKSRKDNIFTQNSGFTFVIINLYIFLIFWDLQLSDLSN